MGPIIVVRLLSHLVMEGGKRRAGIPALIPGFGEATGGMIRVGIPAVRAPQQLLQFVEGDGAGLQRSGEGLDTDHRLILGKFVEPGLPVDGKKCIGDGRRRYIAAQVQIQPIDLGPVPPVAHVRAGCQPRQHGVELFPSGIASSFVEAAIVRHGGHDRFAGAALTLQEVLVNRHTQVQFHPEAKACQETDSGSRVSAGRPNAS